MEKFSGFIYTYVLYVFYVPALKNIQCIYDKPINALYVFYVQALKKFLYLSDKPTDA
jgi:hypothetical protein